MGEYNAKARDTGSESRHFFVSNGDTVVFPPHLLKPFKKIEYDPDKPFDHLGRVGYRRNTYQFRGPNREENNIYGSNHMKKTLWYEEMRRRIMSEEIGIYPDIDKTSLAGKSELYYIRDPRFSEAAPRPKDKSNKNKYYTPGRKPRTFSKKKK